MANAWEQRELGDMGKPFASLSGKSKENFGHGAGRFVTYMNVFSNPISDPTMTEPIEIDNKQHQVQYGDIFFTTSSETPEEVGMSSVWLENQPNTYLNSFCFGFRPLEEYDSYYLAYMLRSNTMRKKIVFLAQGISRYNISKNKMMEIDAYNPKREEQEKIGAIINAIDNLITLHQREHFSIKVYKGVLAEVHYEVNWANDWEQRELGKVAETYSGGTPSVGVKEYYGGEIPFIRSGEISGEDTEIFLTEKGLQNSSAKMVKVGDILYALYGATSGEVSVSLINGAINQAILAILPHKGFDAKFISYWLRRNKKHIIETYLQGGQGNLSGDIVKSLVLICPKYKEQLAVGNIISQIDDLITLHQCKDRS